MGMSDFTVYNNIGKTLPLAASQGKTASRAGGSAFGDVLTEAIRRADQLEKAVPEQVGNIVNGQSNLHAAAVMSIQQADLSFQVMLQVRNKIVQAYEEVMRMPV
jgi:flagellar hook-basal body complex protein FliE